MKKMENIILKQGCQCDIIRILSSKRRDYLIRNNGEQIKIKSLAGKIIGIYVIKLSYDNKGYMSSQERGTKAMVEAYDQLSATEGDFEIVVVAPEEDKYGKRKYLFNKLFSDMPWLAIPYSDLEARRRFISLPRRCFIVDKRGIVLKTDADYYFKIFGADWYPFTKERVREILIEEREIIRENTLRSLLSSSSRDYVISNTKERVPISQLEEKVVALYFYVSITPIFDRFRAMLIKLYHKLKKSGENFEIVMIYLHYYGDDYKDNEESFEKDFKSMPWLALPFMDPTCRKLLRFFDPYLDEDVLVIIGPGGNTFYRNSARFLHFGVKAYPCTLKDITDTEIARLKSYTLESLLVNLDLCFLHEENGAKIHVSELAGKKILVFVGLNGCSKSCELLEKLVDWDGHIMGNDQGFEVVCLSKDKQLYSFKKFYNNETIPWPTYDFAKDLTEIFKTYCPCLLGFGPDGRLLISKGEVLLEDWRMNECELYTYLFSEVYDELKDYTEVGLYGTYEASIGSPDIDRVYDERRDCDEDYENHEENNKDGDLERQQKKRKRGERRQRKRKRGERRQLRAGRFWQRRRLFS